LPGLPRDEIVVQTKIGPRPTAKEFLEVFEISLTNLGLEYVDLLGVHGINLPEHLDMALAKGGTMEAVRQLQKEGRVRHVGFSTHGLESLIRRTIETGEFDYVNLHWYFVNMVNGPSIEAAKKEDMGVFIISPNDKGGKLYAPSEKMKSLCDPLSPMAFNDLWCLCNENVHTLSLGASRPEDFDEHIGAMKKFAQRQEVTARIAERIHAEAVQVLGEAWWTRWQEGIPDWDQIPNEVNVWEILRLWNWAQVLDLVDFGKMRYNLLGQGGHWFPGKNAGRFNKRKMHQVLKQSPFREEVLDRIREAHTLLLDTPKERLSQS
jgi:predicted aldo/keto reductase-like oxidoreductase